MIIFHTLWIIMSTSTSITTDPHTSRVPHLSLTLDMRVTHPARTLFPITQVIRPRRQQVPQVPQIRVVAGDAVLIMSK